MTVIKPSPIFLTSSLNFLLLPSTFSYLPCICPSHGNFWYVQNFRLVIENRFCPSHTEAKPNFVLYFMRSRSSFSVNFHLKNLYHRPGRKKEVESQFPRETADLDTGLLGRSDYWRGGKQLYSAVHSNKHHQN